MPHGARSERFYGAGGTRLRRANPISNQSARATVTAARRSWAAAHKDALVRYVRALGSAFKYIRDPDNRPNVVRTIVETTGFGEANAQLTLGMYFEPDRGVVPKAGEISLKGMEQVIALMEEGGILTKPLPPAERLSTCNTFALPEFSKHCECSEAFARQLECVADR